MIYDHNLQDNDAMKHFPFYNTFVHYLMSFKGRVEGEGQDKSRLF